MKKFRWMDALEERVSPIACGAILMVAGCASEIVCTKVSCDSRVSWSVPLAGPLSEIQSLSIAFCVNDRCIVGPLSALSGSLPGGDLHATLPTPQEASKPELELTLAPRGDGFALQAHFVAASPADLRDGDHVRAQLLDVASKVVAEVDQSVRYGYRYPNGPDCGWGCREVSLGQP